MKTDLGTERYIAALSRFIAQRFPNGACDADDLSQAGRLALLGTPNAVSERNARGIIRTAILNEAVRCFFHVHASLHLKWGAIRFRSMCAQGANESVLLKRFGDQLGRVRRIAAGAAMENAYNG